MSSITRRDLLCGLSTGTVALSAGCGRLASENEVPPDDTIASVSVTNVREFAPGWGLSASVKAVRPWVTTDQTALIEIAFRNNGVAQAEVVVNEGEAPFLSERASIGPPPKVSLPTATDDESSLARPRGSSNSGCWRLRRPVIFPQHARYFSRISPIDETSYTLQVWGHYQNEGCLPTGTFRFEDRYEVLTETGATSFKWGFTIQIM